MIDLIRKQEYDQIILNSRKNPPMGYSEIHHIIPHSLGGSDEDENTVRLSAHDHYRCHEILAEMFPISSIERQKMAFALHKMAYGTSKNRLCLNAEDYEKIRILNATAVSEMQLKRFEDPKKRERQVEICLANSLKRAEMIRSDPKIAQQASKAAQAHSKQMVAGGTHNFLGGSIQKEMWKRSEFRENQISLINERVAKGQHVFQDPKFISQNVEKLKTHWKDMTEDERKERGRRISAGQKRSQKLKSEGT